MMPEDLIRACYRQLLGREPESDQVVAAKVGYSSCDELLASFLESDEYRKRFPPHFWAPYFAAPARVDVHVTDESLSKMFDRIQHEWSKLGQDDPYWSVLTHDDFRAESIDGDRSRIFFETGAETDRIIDRFCERAGVSPPTGRCIEFGAGVGRVTAHLARRFQEVIAVDISVQNLALCAESMERLGVHNVKYVLIKSVKDISLLPNFDFLFSTIVLQHNPPPVQYFILDNLFSKTNAGSIVLFQAPTHTMGYEFEEAAYLSSPLATMELHSLPMPDVLRLMAKHQLDPLEVVMDGWTGLYGSHTFFGSKRSGSPG
jgi:2-polyprenyl-3-methyl-5-hydroxy-6-metoxy-1,4-benzoquinol methylase